MTGGGLSPRQSCRSPSIPSSSSSSSSASCPDKLNDHVGSLLNVRDMHQRLLQHIQTLTSKMQADEEHFSQERHALLEQQQQQAQAKDTEIEACRVKLAQHDHKTDRLKKDNTRKEMAIFNQLAAIEQLKNMLQHIVNHADRIHIQFMSDRNKVQTGRVCRLHPKECSILGPETQMWRQQLAAVEQGFLHITKILQETYEEMRAFHTDSTATLNHVLAIKDILSGQRRQSGAHTEHPHAAGTTCQQLVQAEIQSATAAAARILQETYEEMRAFHTDSTATLNHVLAIKDILSGQRRQSGAHTEHPHAAGTTCQQLVQAEIQSATAAAARVGPPMTRSTSNTDCKRQTIKALPVCMVRTGVLCPRQLATRGQVRKGTTFNKT